MNRKESLNKTEDFHGLETAPTTMICDIDESSYFIRNVSSAMPSCLPTSGASHSTERCIVD